MFDDLFGGVFGFNDDGTTDFLETATGFAILDELLDDDTDDFDLDSDDDWDF